MRFDRLAGFALIFIGALALFGRTTGAGLRVGAGEKLLDSRQERIEASALRTLVLTVEAGSLVVLGERGTDAVRLRAEFLGPGEDALDGLILSHARRGDALQVETRTSRSQGRIDLELTVPAGLEILIDDGSGSIRVAGIEGPVSIEDGSGSITVRDLAGDLGIEDGSGSIIAERVGGAVRIDDGSGSIRVHHAGADVEINDGSGSISVRDVGGDVTVRDGSGSIRVSDVDGRFHLAANGSGPVSTSGIRGGTSS